MTATNEPLERATARRHARLTLARNILLAAVVMTVTVWCWPSLAGWVLGGYDLLASWLGAVR